MMQNLEFNRVLSIIVAKKCRVKCFLIYLVTVIYYVCIKGRDALIELVYKSFLNAISIYNSDIVADI